MAARQKLLGRAYGFMNCRRAKAEVEWIASDIKDFFAESNPELEYLQKLQIKVNQGTSAINQNAWRTVEDKGGLLTLVRESEKEGLIFTRPCTVRLHEGDTTIAHCFGNLYTIRASLPDATNKAVADELAAIVNQMYNSPLYEKDEPFRGIIAYWNGSKYLLRG